MSEVAAPAGRSPAFCGGCGAALKPGARFCTECGTQVGEAPATPPPPNPLHPDAACGLCGGDGSRLPSAESFCSWCRWLRPLGSDYALPVELFMWELDAAAMGNLRAIGPLNAAAHELSSRIGRPWFESAVNGIRLGPDQLPDVFAQAVLAARIIGLARMPEIYVSGEQMWDAATLGDNDQAFVVLGSVLTHYQGDDLLYLFGREMGHIAAGHALWRTVTRFVSGQSANRTIMGEGILQFINPAKLVESAIDAPLMAWARHSEITADRAGLLVVGSADVARRVATQWTLKSFPIFKRLNMAALDRQIAEARGQAFGMAEATMSSQPYLSRRLQLQAEFAASQEFAGWRAVIEHWVRSEMPVVAASPAQAKRPRQDLVRIKCMGCGEPLRFPRERFGPEGKPVKVRCPNAACRKVIEVRPSPRKIAPPRSDMTTD